VDKADALNQKLIAELQEKNAIIRKQADSELNQLNQQLLSNLEELTRSEFFLKKAQKTAKVGSWQFYPKDVQMFWSDQMYEIFEINGKGINRSHANVFNFPEAATIIKENFVHQIDREKETDLTVQIKSSNGTRKWLRILGFPNFTNGECTSVSGIVHDITYFKESEQRIMATERNYKSLFEQASDLIMITDLKGKFVDVNTSMCKVLGYEKEELLQLNIANVIDPEQLREKPIQFKELIGGAHVINERLMLHKNGSIVPVEANVKRFGDHYLMAIARDIRDRKKANYLLNERIKELSTLYSVSQLLSLDSKPMEDVLAEIPDFIPSGWQYPEICVARLSIQGKTYESENYRPSQYSQKALLFDDESEIGVLEVAYLEERPEEYEGPFFREERNLLNTLAEMIQIYVKRKKEQEERNKAQANLKATINNTEIYIWSLDHNFNVLTFNDTFSQYVHKYFGKTVYVGCNHRDLFTEQRVRKWEERYKRVLTGELVILEETSHEMDFRFSLSPIIENGKVTGISIFADNVTEDNKRARELEEANRKINEHKIMALRSVMNPHFIFNVLSSIQYFITRNDQFNAINYLTSFSKLMRTVLTRSVADRIPLKDELEMLKDYVNLEKLRFEEKFEFRIEHDPALEVDAIRIPSLLVQPYVENAILHGLYNKEGAGTLTMRVKMKEPYLIFEIEDDGIGRQAAAQMNTAKDPKRKSMGTKLTEERLKLINQDSEVAVSYTDLREGNSPAGTLVQIRIKLEE
jgi:PAS domain S-box-containing protein